MCLLSNLQIVYFYYSTKEHHIATYLATARCMDPVVLAMVVQNHMIIPKNETQTPFCNKLA